MLAIVPPIIRGRIEESPLATTQSFQRSMEEIAHSIESGSSRSASSYRKGAAGRHGDYPVDMSPTRPARPVAVSRRRTSAAARRNRVFTVLTFLAFTWGTATLFSGKTWCLAVFTAFSVLLIIFWLLTILVPFIAASSHPERLRERGGGRNPSRYQDRQAI